MKRITVLLAEDHQIVREGFRSLLKHEGDIEVVGEAETGRQAVQLTRKLRPAVVVMDIAMPLLNGLEATRQIRKAVPDTKVLILSAHSDDSYVEQVTQWGAVGFLLKQTSSHVLATAIREVQKGNTFFSPSISKRVKDRRQKSLDRGEKGSNRLSSREVEVLQLIGHVAHGGGARRLELADAAARPRPHVLVVGLHPLLDHRLHPAHESARAVHLVRSPLSSYRGTPSNL